MATALKNKPSADAFHSAGQLLDVALNSPLGSGRDSIAAAAASIASSITEQALKDVIRTRLIQQFNFTQAEAEEALITPEKGEENAPELEAKLTNPALLANYVHDVQQTGVAGETANLGCLIVAQVSRLLQGPSLPINVIIKSQSSSGKNYILDRTLAFLPDEAFFRYTAWTEKVLAYNEDDWSHRVIVVGERHGTGGNHLMRQFLQDGSLVYEVVEKNEEGKLVTRKIQKNGPIAYFTTTTEGSIHHEDETRLLSLSLDETTSQTRSVMENTVLMHSGSRAHIDPSEYHALHRKIERAATIVPPELGRALAASVPASPVRMRRDFTKLLAFMEAIALLYQHQRARDNEGRVIVTLADYAMAEALLRDVFSASLGDTSPQALQLARKVWEIGVPVTTQDLAQKLNRSDDWVRKWAPAAEAASWIEADLPTYDHERKNGRPPSVWERGEAEPSVALPSPASIARHLGVTASWVDPITGEASSTETVP
jgi:hypothetical protein